jgi:hypothetical protein
VTIKLLLSIPFLTKTEARACGLAGLAIGADTFRSLILLLLSLSHTPHTEEILQMNAIFLCAPSVLSPHSFPSVVVFSCLIYVHIAPYVQLGYKCTGIHAAAAAASCLWLASLHADN